MGGRGGAEIPTKFRKSSGFACVPRHWRQLHLSATVLAPCETHPIEFVFPPLRCEFSPKISLAAGSAHLSATCLRFLEFESNLVVKLPLHFSCTPPTPLRCQPLCCSSIHRYCLRCCCDYVATSRPYMARAAFTTSYDEDGPLKRQNEECNEYFYEQRRKAILGDREDSEEIFRNANPSIDLPRPPGEQILRRSDAREQYLPEPEIGNVGQSGAVALYQIPKLYAGDIDQPRRLMSLPPVPQEQLKQYAHKFFLPFNSPIWRLVALGLGLIFLRCK